MQLWGLQLPCDLFPLTDGHHQVAGRFGVTDVPMVAVAKGQDRDAGRETFFMDGREPFRLPPRDPLL